MNTHAKRRSASASPRRGRKVAWIGGGIALAAVATVAVAVFAGRSDEDAFRSMSPVSTADAPSDASARPVVEVYKDATCGCCSKWVEHLQQAGFEVRTTDTRELPSFKARHGVPHHAESCHTALVAGYVVEGHVPASDIQRLLRERPAIAGLAVPGMPIGSPGMEVPGTPAQPYDVIAFEKNGDTQVFARHGR